MAPTLVAGEAGHELLEGRYHGVGFDGSAYLRQALLQGIRFVVIPRGVCVVDVAGQAGGDVDGCGDAKIGRASCRERV